MKSFQVLEWGKPLQQVLARTPEPTGSEVLVRIKACGVCHSDVHIRHGFYDLGAGKKVQLSDIGLNVPLTMGHEIAGTVKAAGPLARATIGMDCVVYPWIGCGGCRHCRRGAELDCETPRSLGTRRAGGYADHVLVPHSRYVLPLDGLDPYVAASAACSGLTAYSALKKLPQCTSEDVVVVLGAGGLGLAALGLARAVTSARLAVLDTTPEKLELAQSKAELLLDGTTPDSLRRLHEFAGGGAVGVLDFVGLPQTVEWGMSALRKGGTLVEVGLFGGAISLSIPLFPMRNLKLIGSYVGSLKEFEELLSLLRREPIGMAPLIARPMEEINEVFAEIEAGKVPGRIMAIV